MDKATLYIHIPFCQRLCGYCDFYKTISSRHIDSYPDALIAEAQARSGEIGGKELQTIYFGGGTPSLIPPDQIGRLLNRFAELWECSAVEEITLEANPDDLSPERLEGYRRAGINRLSIGIQSFDDRELLFMNRRHNAQQARQAVMDARRAGFENISIDLIFGTPGSTPESLRNNIEEALSLSPEHISAYHLTIEPATLFGKRGVEPVEEEQSEEQYLILHRMLIAEGYDHYEISNYAKEGRRSLHNSNYWRGVPYLGLGPAAHSYDGERRTWNIPSIGRYMADPTHPSLRESELLGPTERYEEFVMVGLRTREGINIGEVERLFGSHKRSYLLRQVATHIASGVVIEQEGHLRCDPEHWLVSDAVIADLF